MSDNIIKYGSRTFGEIREDLISMIKQSYSDVLSDFSDSSVGSMLIDINAGVANNLAINTDRVFQETQLDNAQQISSILNIAKNMGFNIPPKRPSVTVVDFTVTIPVLGDKPDPNYYPILESGAQLIGGGKIFETQNKIDWSLPKNRRIIPNTDSNGIIINYDVTKRDVVFNGSSQIYRKVITSSDVVPFFSITLPDSNIIGIDSVILMEGTNVEVTDNDFKNSIIRYYEVDYLAQQRVFVEDFENSNPKSDLKIGKWIDVTKKFIKEFTPNGFCKLTFGSGDATNNAFRDGLLKDGITNKYFLENFLNNTSLGEKLKSGYTLFVKYRTGGGSNSNIGSNVLTKISNYNLVVNGSLETLNRQIRDSIKVNNPIPAIGGNDGLTVEQIRNLIKYNFSSQYRDVTLNDYLLQVYKMPGKFGSPFRLNAYKENNKVIISIINIGSDGKLSNKSNDLLKQNIAEYLSQFRMINDYIEIKDGKIFNLAFDIDIYVDNINDNQIANGVINVVKKYFDVNNSEMNKDVFIGKLQTEILSVSGVVNVIDISVYNKVGNGYSHNTISQEISDVETGKILLINNTIYSSEDSMFEIKYPEKDIKILMRKNVEI